MLLTSEQLISGNWGLNALLRGTKLSAAEWEESFTYTFYTSPTATQLNEKKSNNGILDE